MILYYTEAPVTQSSSSDGNLPYSNRMQVGGRSDSIRGFLQDGNQMGNSWKIPPRPAGRTITWTDYDESAKVEEQKKRLKNLNKVLKSKFKMCL